MVSEVERRYAILISVGLDDAGAAAACFSADAASATERE